MFWGGGVNNEGHEKELVSISPAVNWKLPKSYQGFTYLRLLPADQSWFELAQIKQWHQG